MGGFQKSKSPKLGIFYICELYFITEVDRYFVMNPTPKKVTVIEQLISDIHNYNINHHTRELYLHAHFDSDGDYVDHKMSVTFVKNINLLDSQNNKNILVHMQTNGGSWGDGMSIFDSVRFIKSPVTILAYSQASSMSGIILQAADKRIMTQDCELMIHYGSINMDENALAAKSVIFHNEKNSKRMLEIFAKRAINGKYFQDRSYNLRKTMSFIDSKIKQNSDWYLDAEESVYYGFADGIFGQKGFESFAKIRSGRKKINF